MPAVTVTKLRLSTVASDSGNLAVPKISKARWTLGFWWLSVKKEILPNIVQGHDSCDEIAWREERHFVFLPGNMVHRSLRLRPRTAKLS